MSKNPLLAQSPLPLQAPPFDLILTEHYHPAFDEAMSQQLGEIDAIKTNPQAPSFRNTVEALEMSGQLLHRVSLLFSNQCSANTNPKMQRLQQQYAPIFAQHHDAIFLDSTLYARVKAVYDQRASLEGEELRLVEYYDQRFTMAGAGLDEATKAELKQMNERLATLETTFGNILLEARKQGALVVDTEEELAGMPEDEVRAARTLAESLGHQGGKLALSLTNTTQQTQLAVLQVRETRRRLYEASVIRAHKNDANDTRGVLEEIVRLRLQKAKLLGKSCFAEWKLQDQMAEVPSAWNLLKEIAEAAVAKAEAEASDIQALVYREGNAFELQPWDWSFYAERLRAQKYDLKEDDVVQYFELHTVLEKGVFYAAKELYGITFVKRLDLPVYDPDVVVYEVFEANGITIALYYLDFYTRPNKNGGAWMTNYVEQSTELQQKPVIANVFNYAKPTKGKPTLLTFWNVTTMFHEFGHSLHGFFSRQRYPSLGGISNVPRDFVEFPSQINEKWALHPTVLHHYARHHETGAPIPSDLVDKIKRASSFNEGFKVLEVVSSALVDMQWHTVTDATAFSPAIDFEQAALKQHHVKVHLVPPRYLSSYFLHIFGGGYAAGYYAYLWAEVLDHDAYEWMQQNGGLSRAVGESFRKHILSVGNSVNLKQAFVNMVGREPSVSAMLRSRSLVK